MATSKTTTAVEPAIEQAPAPAMTAKNAEAVLFNSPKQRLIAAALKSQFRIKIRNEEQVPVTLAPSYRHPFGKVMCVRLHGHSIYVPCDGKTYNVPRSYAAIIHARRRAFDEQELKQERMAQVTNNNEQYAGQLQFG